MTDFLTFLTATLETMGHTYSAPIGMESHFEEDLGLDSLDMLEVIVAIEDHYRLTVNVDGLATGTGITVALLHNCSLEGTQ